MIEDFKEAWMKDVQVIPPFMRGLDLAVDLPRITTTYYEQIGRILIVNKILDRKIVGEMVLHLESWMDKIFLADKKLYYEWSKWTCDLFTWWMKQFEAGEFYEGAENFSRFLQIYKKIDKK